MYIQSSVLRWLASNRIVCVVLIDGNEMGLSMYLPSFSVNYHLTKKEITISYISYRMCDKLNDRNIEVKSKAS